MPQNCRGIGWLINYHDFKNLNFLSAESNQTLQIMSLPVFYFRKNQLLFLQRFTFVFDALVFLQEENLLFGNVAKFVTTQHILLLLLFDLRWHYCSKNKHDYISIKTTYFFVIFHYNELLCEKIRISC